MADDMIIWCSQGSHWLLLVTVVTVTQLLVTNAQDTADAKIEALQDVVKQLSRQSMLQQLFVEERIRSEGDSGLKQVKVYRPFMYILFTQK